MKNKSFNPIWCIIAFGGVAIIALPIILLFIEDTREYIFFLLQHLNLEEKDFLSLWITFWSAVIALCSLLQWRISPNTQEQLKASQAQVKIGQEQLTANIKFNQESLDIQQKQLELQANKIIEEQYIFLKKAVTSNNDVEQLEAVKDLFKFAVEQDDRYKHRICRLFCTLIRKSHFFICSNDRAKMPDHIEEMIRLLFSEPHPFDRFAKDLTNSFIFGISIKNIKISNANFSGSRIVDCVLHNSQISECVFNNAQISDSLLKTTNIKGTDFQNCMFSNVTFNKTHITNLMFCKTKIHNSIFGNCRIMNVNFEDTEIQDTQFSKTKFSDRCNMESSEIVNTSFLFPNMKYKNSFKQYLSQLHLSKSNEEGNIIKIN